MNDESDPTIEFNEQGVCNYCRDALSLMEREYHPDQVGRAQLDSLIAKLKHDGKDKRYDCLMGISGGLDSSYLAYLGAEHWGLRIAGVHIDDGYDTEISKSNLEKLVDKTGIHLVTITPDAEQFNALTLAYMRAGVPNLAAPQDNVLFAALYDFARKNDIRNFLSGENLSLESILQRGNTWSAYDVVNIKDIHSRFGEKPVDKLQFKSSLSKLADQYLLGLKTFKPLNLVSYKRDQAFQELYDYCGFEYYGRKHLENHLTAFAQLCWFPEKFGVDKRTSHLSSMIISGQMSRDEALELLGEPLYDAAYMEEVKDMLCANMEISREELESLIVAPGHQHDEYRIEKLVPAMVKVYHAIKR